MRLKDPVLQPGQAGTYNGYPVIKGTKEPVSRMAETHALLPTGEVETDPNGLAPHVVGAKLDSGKNRLGLVLGDFANALEQVGWVGTGGAKKYTPRGWMSVDNGTERYTDAMLRHMIKHCKGEKADPDTKLLHLAHAAWNVLAVLELELRKSIPAR